MLDQLIQYGTNPFPISRPPEDIIHKTQDGHCQSSLQLSILVANLGNLARPMKFGGKEVHVCNSEKLLKNAKFYSSGPNMVTKFFMHNWAHVRVILEAKGLINSEAIRNEIASHCIYGVHGRINSEIAIYVAGPQGPTGTEIRVLYESNNKSCPWSAFEVRFAKESCFEDQQDFAKSKLGQKRKEMATRRNK